MQSIGKIDVLKYQPAAANKIVTDEVVLTDNQREHIIKRRGQQFFDEYFPLFADIISDPDYIFKDKNKNTVLAAKTISNNGTSVNIVLRLAVEGENHNYKNSIITAVKEGRLRNNAPIYKKT